MSTEKSVFGYGSLILPISTIARFDEKLSEKIWDIGEESDNRLKDLLEFYLEDKQLKRWENSELKFLPAKIHGYRRYYALEMEEEGNQLTAVESNEDEFINGVVIYPLTETEFEEIAGTEEGYDKQEISLDNIEFYFDHEEDLPEETVFFTGTDHSLIDMNTEETRDPNYHRFIEEGIRLVAKEHLDSEKRIERFREQFMEDFRKHTYEKHDGNWEKLSEISNGD